MEVAEVTTASYLQAAKGQISDNQEILHSLSYTERLMSKRCVPFYQAIIVQQDFSCLCTQQLKVTQLLNLKFSNVQYVAMARCTVIKEGAMLNKYTILTMVDLRWGLLIITQSLRHRAIYALQCSVRCNNIYYVLV